MFMALKVWEGTTGRKVQAMKCFRPCNLVDHPHSPLGPHLGLLPSFLLPASQMTSTLFMPQGLCTHQGHSHSVLPLLSLFVLPTQQPSGLPPSGSVESLCMDLPLFQMIETHTEAPRRTTLCEHSIGLECHWVTGHPECKDSTCSFPYKNEQQHTVAAVGPTHTSRNPSERVRAKGSLQGFPRCRRQSQGLGRGLSEQRS